MKLLINKILRKFYSNQISQPKNDIERYENIGKNVRLMGENVLDKVNPHLVYIGDNCVIGYRSSILTHCPIRGPKLAKLGDYVWLGFGVVILPGASVGNNTIVGGGSVVTKSFPESVIIAGNPARVIRKLTEEEVKSLKYRLKNKIPMGKDDFE